MDSGNTNEFQRKIQRIRRVETTPADENYRKIDGVTCLVQSSRDSKSSRRFRIELSTAVSDAPPFCKPIIIAPPHRRRFSPTGPWIIHRIDRPPIVLAPRPFSRLTILRDSWASLIRFRRRDPRERGEKFKILLILIFRRKKFLSKISYKLSNIETENFGSSWKKIPNSINNISILFFELFSADERRINDENSSERKIFSFEIFQR